MSVWVCDFYQVVNAVQYYENEVYAESVESTWVTEEDARIRLAELAAEKDVEFSFNDSIFFEPPMGSNVEYSEWRIDTWEAHRRG